MLNVTDASKETTPSGSSPEQTPIVKEDATKIQEEELGSGNVNYDERFKKIYGKMKELERENEVLKTPVVAKEEPTEDTFTPNTWDEVFEKLEQHTTQKQTQKEKEIETNLAIVNKQIIDLKTINPGIDENKLWQYMEENKTLNVYEAFIKTNVTVKDAKDNKEVSKKIGSNVKNTTSKAGMSYVELQKMSLDDIHL